ncbi:MAG: cysteine--tRNA ligase [Candidatus Uhrbacteria bacterium]|nr:cysteine--tRNA ligase [Candidatus Uhrbacteria bacterium]
MTVSLYNTLNRTKEEFKPIHRGKVGLYACGPTVYQNATIGNFRTFLMTDVLRRTLEFNGYEVRHVMNITDVGHLTDDGDEGEDKMMVTMRKEGKSAWDIAEFYTKRFLKDMERLNIVRPTVMPKATEHISEQIELIKLLEEKGFTYRTSDGVYFETSKFEAYGKFSGQNLEEKEAGTRVEANPEKHNPSDFALWKYSKPEEKRQMEWDSPWGVGFPGWHIECSAMSEKYLDSPFDIHTGGIDLKPVHHENEIAQTTAAHGNALANYWLHGEFLLIDNGKMSKSLGNVYIVEDLILKGFEALAYRYFSFTAHYRTKLNFTWEALEAAQNALNNLRDVVRDWDEPTDFDKDAIQRFLLKLNDDLDMPGAIAEVWGLVNDESIESSIKSATILKIDEVLGFNLIDYVSKPVKVSDKIRKLLEDRKVARENKDWNASDVLRDQIADAGYMVEDTSSGQKVRERHD